MPDLVLLSGGLDSSTALAHSLTTENPGNVLALSVNYGQRHAVELDAARAVAQHYGVAHRTLNLTGWGELLTGSALTDDRVELPEGHYAAESMKATIVPNRNATLLSAAAGVAISAGCDRVVTAVHAGDHAIYPDCRPEFIDLLNLAIQAGTEDAVSIAAPFVNWSKDHIAVAAHLLHVPIALTWSCYAGGDLHCGRCGTCTERREALDSSGFPDPTAYEVAA